MGRHAKMVFLWYNLQCEFNSPYLSPFLMKGSSWCLLERRNHGTCEQNKIAPFFSVLVTSGALNSDWQDSMISHREEQ